jgi:putative membrane protein
MTRHTQLKMLRTLPLAVALAFGAGLAGAQSKGQTGGGTTGTGTSATGGNAAPQVQGGSGTRNAESRKDDKLARGDRKFIEEAAGSGMFEVQVGQLASTKATDPAVKSFASMLVDEHSAANNELTQLANAKHVELPAAPPRTMRKKVEDLAKKSGAEFDREFVRDVGIKDHEQDIKKFEKASKDVKDPELKAWVDKTLPHLRQHLAAAQKLPQAGGKGGNDAAAMGNRASKPNAKGDMATTPGGAATGTQTGHKTGS